jgi:hypothetical protein
MNLRRWLQRTRHALGQTCVAVFGRKIGGGFGWGTGILIDLRGTSLILSCAHVLDPLVDPVFVASGDGVRHTGAIYSARLSDPSWDWACLLLRDWRVLERKIFVPASEVILERVATDEAVAIHGFPIGHPDLQVGGRIDEARAQAHFKSLTYFTLTGVPMHNTRLGRVQPRVEWTPRGNVNSKTFKKIEHNLTPEQRGGFSGGPVFHSNTRKLIGQLTDASERSLFYNSMGDILRRIDARL